MGGGSPTPVTSGRTSSFRNVALLLRTPRHKTSRAAIAQPLRNELYGPFWPTCTYGNSDKNFRVKFCRDPNASAKFRRDRCSGLWEKYVSYAPSPLVLEITAIRPRLYDFRYCASAHPCSASLTIKMVSERLTASRCWPVGACHITRQHFRHIFTCISNVTTTSSLFYKNPICKASCPVTCAIHFIAFINLFFGEGNSLNTQESHMQSILPCYLCNTFYSIY